MTLRAAADRQSHCQNPMSLMAAEPPSSPSTPSLKPPTLPLPLRSLTLTASSQPLAFSASIIEAVAVADHSPSPSLSQRPTVPDTYAASHIQLTSTTACAAAEKATVNKTTKYAALAATHYFVPVAIETSGAWCPQSRNSSKIWEDGSLRLPTSRSRQNTERQCSRLMQHFSRALIFFYIGRTILTGKPYYN